MTPVILAFFFANASPYAEICVVDQSGRGVPLVELETVNHQIFVTDNAGRVAFNEPGLMGTEVFFHVRSHGYEAKKDGFGFAGAKVTPVANRTAVIRLNCSQLAERLCRLTGEGLYRDSQLLGYPVPQFHPGVAGQDSIQTAMYKGKRIWLWGDTNRMNYPLGHYRTAGAFTNPFDKNFDPSHGINFEYVREKGNIKAMMPYKEHPEGVVWLDGLCTVHDDKSNKEALVAHYSRRKGLGTELEHGITLYDDEFFQPNKPIEIGDWRHPHGHAVTWKDNDVEWIGFGEPVVNVRVQPLNIFKLEEYEAYTCEVGPGVVDPSNWHWQKKLPPADAKRESQWLKEHKIQPDKTRFHPSDAADETKHITLHNGTVQWNNYRKCWIMLACQQGGSSSYLGEVWYSEAKEPTGPFTKAVKVVTHNKQTFYNVCHHPFLDQDDGRTIFFEGTYTEEFSGSHHFTPRYDYNQVLYKLVLSSPELVPARVR